MIITKITICAPEDIHPKVIEYMGDLVEVPDYKHGYTDLLLTPDQLAHAVGTMGVGWKREEGEPYIHSMEKVAVINIDSQIADKITARVADLDLVLTRMQVAAARLEAQHVIACDDGLEADAGWNAKTQSPMSGPVLHSFNELMLCEDCCTDALQTHLNEGWRLVAVCPQESRRPDYVLGRVAQPTISDRAHRG